MPVDALATRLAVLLQDGSVAGSALSRSMRRSLQALFDFGVLREERAGAGRRVVLEDRAALLDWVTSQYPSGLDGAGDALPERAAAVATFRDSKGGKALAGRAVFMRGFESAKLTRVEEVLPLADLTRQFGLAGVLVEQAPTWTLEGTLALVENFEVFLHAETVVPGADAALWTAGRVDGKLLDWLAAMPAVEVVHAGDYDPVGLDEYLRVVAALPGRTRLFVPDDFELRLVRFGNRDLLARSAAVLERVRRNRQEEVRAVLAVMDRHGLGLEQEALLVPVSADPPPTRPSP